MTFPMKFPMKIALPGFRIVVLILLNFDIVVGILDYEGRMKTNLCMCLFT